LLAISPQRPEYLRQMIDKHKLTFDVLSDAGNTVAAQFGVKFTVSDAVKKIYQGFGIDLEKVNADGEWTLPMPARFIIDRDGVIRYAQVDPDYTVRPEPEHTVAALRTLTRA
jgi:peroxiredoxin